MSRKARHVNVVELDVPQLESQLGEIERTMGEPISRPFRLLLAAYLSLLQTIGERNISIDRLRRMLFGAPTERTNNVVPKADSSQSTPAGADH